TPPHAVCLASDLAYLSSPHDREHHSFPARRSSDLNGDDTHTYTFTPDDTDCYNPFPFTVNVTGAANTVFASLPTDDVCVVSDLSSLEHTSEVHARYKPVCCLLLDNGDDTHTYTLNP